MSTGILTKGTKLSYKLLTVLTELLDLQEVPELGGKAEKVEVTTLKDGSKRYINGLVDYGDLSFKFLYDNTGATSSYRVLSTMEKAGLVNDFEIELPDHTKFTFSGQVSTVVNSAAPNGALTFNLNITLNSAITVVDPV